jgi:archaellum component FlaC
MDDGVERIEQAIGELRVEVSQGFGAVNERLAGVNERLAGVDERLVGVDERLVGVDERLVGVDERLVGVDERLAGVDRRFVSVDEQFAALRQEVRQGDADTRSRLSVQIESLRDDIRIFAEAHVALEQRVTAIERRPR